MKTAYTLTACSDCVIFVANGDVPEDRPNLAQEIADNLGLALDQHVVDASGLDSDGEWYRDANDEPIDMDHPEYEAHCEDWFSWSRCECCGSDLGGMRNRLSVLERTCV